MDIIHYIRELAKSDSYQNLYMLAKEIGTIKILDNISDFTNIQHTFFRYLVFYYNLYTDIALGEISDIVLENEIYEDSYMMYKNKSQKKILEDGTNKKSVENVDNIHATKWIFKDKNKNILNNRVT